MFASLDPLTIDDTAPVPLIDPDLLFMPSSSSNSAGSQLGYSMLLVTDGSIKLGGQDVGQSTSTLAAGRIALENIRDSEIPWVIAPTGQTVHIQRFVSGLKTSGTPYGELGFDVDGLGAWGFGE